MAAMKLGFIGAGNMAGAIVKGVVESGFLPADQVMVYDVNEAVSAKLQERFQVRVAESNPSLVEACDVIVLAVKPVYLKQVLMEVRPFVQGKKVVSIAAGWTTHMLTNLLDEVSGAQVLRVMPNTPAMIGEGYTAFCAEHTLDEATFDWVNRLFQTLGETQVFPERLFDAVIAVSGSSPAYVYMFMEAMADGAVKLGMPRKDAYRAAAQAVLGAAKMVLETGEHPGKLKDDVCSPGGTTIEAVDMLERKGLRGAVLAAMEACGQKSRQMADDQQKA